MEKLHQTELLNLIRRGENIHQDFKYAITDSRKIARSLSAFANTEGGSLLIGVKDNGRVAGVRSDEEYYMAESAAKIYSRPEIAFETRIWKYEGKTVLEIKVPESNSKPHYVIEAGGEKNAFIRVGDQNIKANQVIRKVWEIKKQRTDRLVRYSKAEESLFRLLNEKEFISLNYFKKKAMLSHNIAVRTLANMIVFGVIDVGISEHHCNYFLKNDKSDDS